ncbi:MAG: hypothetical protein E6I03_02750 [Chloroflexi bacterium]|nr:MAG: hypothetical protein E6I03_02750 [Chloroflexota bacterium]
MTPGILAAVRAELMQEDAENGEGQPAPAQPQMPLGIVIARILVVTSMSFAAAAGIFFLVGGLWLLALGSIAATAIFLGLMFVIERGAESSAGHS